MASATQSKNSPALPSIWFDDEGTDGQLKESVDFLIAGAAVSIMVIACGNNQHSSTYLKSFLSSCAVPIFGGVFPGFF